ncbi:hypothetical protein [Streptomyces sp. NPDC005953]|uniref:hypothetical protein n=1 Tax=Streptomyces sp. NPDC005953 TaxID=3156719 RepID=UPI0033E53B87
MSVYIKIAALAMRPEKCRAKVATIAQYLGLSKSEVERALKQLHNPDPIDHLIEVLTVHKTSRDGEGESAERSVRVQDDDELFVWIPARAATALTPRQLRLYAAITYAMVRRIPLTVQDLADHVRHQHGQNRGEPLTGRQVMRILDSLEDAGWITVHRRQGPRGRHLYEAHRHPLHAVSDTTADAPTAGASTPGERPADQGSVTVDIYDGAAPRTSDGPPKGHDPRTDRPGRKNATAGGGIRRRRSTGSYGAHPVDNPPPWATRPKVPGAGHGEQRSSEGGSVDRPQGALGRRAWEVLAPVRHLLPGVRSFVLARIEQEIARQLATGVGAARLTARLTARYVRTEPIRDPGAWVLAVGLVRRGCELDVCESGRIWHTRQDCQVCLDIVLHHQPAPAGPEPEPESDFVEQPPSPPPPERAPRLVATPVVSSTRPALDEGRPRAWAELVELRASATARDIRDLIAQRGRGAALRLYGWELVLPHLPLEGDGHHGWAQ